VNIFLLRVILILIAIGVTIHVLSIRTLKQWSIAKNSFFWRDVKIVNIQNSWQLLNNYWKISDLAISLFFLKFIDYFFIL
jgi:hypothetical protein